MAGQDEDGFEEQVPAHGRASLFSSEYGQWMAGAIVFITFITWISVSILTGWEIEGIGSYRADPNFMATLNNLGTMIVGGALSLGGAAMSAYRSTRKGKPSSSSVKMDIPANPAQQRRPVPPDMMARGVSAQPSGRPPVPPVTGDGPKG